MARSLTVDYLGASPRGIQRVHNFLNLEASLGELNATMWIKMRKKIIYTLVALLSSSIGIYPLIYLFIDRKFGLLRFKENELLIDYTWNIAFYTHIFLGGIALLIGWVQFSKKIRISRPKLHRQIGKIYVITVIISGISGIYIGFFATGGIISSLGFILLGIIWIYTTFIAFWYAKNNQITKHQILMYYSYAICFSAVTLRIWLPILHIYFQDFIPAYKIVAWLSWIPNLIVAYYLTRNMR